MAALRKLQADSVEAIITDPPYGLGFMGKDWDTPGGTGEFPMRRTTHANTINVGAGRQGERPRSCEAFAGRQARDARSFQAWNESWAREALRVLKPGGYLLAFGGPRTFHRLTCALEDAGFEIRDCICWLYGQGFPKSVNVALAIDKAAGHPDRGRAIPTASRHLTSGRYATEKLTANPVGRYLARGDAAEAWEGWGTALKPAWEPIIVARKPLSGTLAANVLAHQTGALHIDACRIAFRSAADEHESKTKNRHADLKSRARNNQVYGRDERPRGEHGNYDAPGRWPANVLLSHTAGCRQIVRRRVRPNTRSSSAEPIERWECPSDCPVRMLDERNAGSRGTRGGSSCADAGGASRFFYCAKASRAERDAGLRGFDEATTSDGRRKAIENPYQRGTTLRRNVHPTVKPIALMRYLVRLVTPPGGTVLDPFAGSETTGTAAVMEGVRFLGIEREADYVMIARARISHWAARAREAR